MASSSAPVADRKAGPYAWYVLVVLFLVYALNFIDRQILTILAPHIRRDLGLSHEIRGGQRMQPQISAPLLQRPARIVGHMGRSDTAIANKLP